MLSIIIIIKWKNAHECWKKIIDLGRYFSEDCSFNHFFAECLLIGRNKLITLGDFTVDARVKDEEIRENGHQMRVKK